MSYKDLLSRYIANSHLTLSQIEEGMRKKGFSTNKAYISKLQNGKLPPAGEDITRALAEVTHGDPGQLILAGYIEKAPTVVKEHLSKVDDIDSYLEDICKFYAHFIDDEELKKILKQIGIEEYIFTGFIDPIHGEIFERISSQEKLKFINMMFSNAQKQYLRPEELISESNIATRNNKNELEKIPLNKRIMLPIIGVVKAGPNGLAYEELLGEETVDESSINGGKYFWLKVKGDSMIGDGIFEGDLVLVREQPEVESGQLAVVIVDGEEGTIKRVYINPDSIILQSSNPMYPPRVFAGNELSKVRIVGRAKEIKRKL